MTRKTPEKFRFRKELGRNLPSKINRCRFGIFISQIMYIHYFVIVNCKQLHKSFSVQASYGIFVVRMYSYGICIYSLRRFRIACTDKRFIPYAYWIATTCMSTGLTAGQHLGQTHRTNFCLLCYLQGRCKFNMMQIVPQLYWVKTSCMLKVVQNDNQ